MHEKTSPQNYAQKTKNFQKQKQNLFVKFLKTKKKN